VQPRLLWTQLNMSSNELLMYFSEVVNVTSLNISTIRLQTVEDYSLTTLLAFELIVIDQKGPTTRLQFPLYDNLNEQRPPSMTVVEWQGDSSTTGTLDVVDCYFSVKDGAITGYREISTGIQNQCGFSSSSDGDKLDLLGFGEGAQSLVKGGNTQGGNTRAALGTFAFQRDRTQDAIGPNARQYEVLSSGASPIYSLTSSVFSRTMVVSLGTADLNAIKLSEQLGISDSSSCVAIDSGTIQDMHGNDVVAVPANNALQVRTHTEDLVAPEVVAFSLDMNKGELYLTFSEVVEPDTFDVTSISLQPAAASKVINGKKVGEHNLRKIDSKMTKVDDVVITVHIGRADLDGIKKNTRLALAGNTTFLAITAKLVADKNNNSVVAIAGNAALSVADYTPDSTRPDLTKVTLEYIAKNTAQLYLEFSETVLASSLDVTQMTIQGGTSLPGSDANVTLKNGATGTKLAVASDQTYIIIQIGTDDMNELKYKTSVATSTANTFLSVLPGALTDMNNNVINTDIIQAAVFVQDTAPPVLTQASLSMDTGIFVLTFDETVKASSLDTTEITLHACAQSSCERVALSANSTTASDNGIAIQIDVGVADRNAIKNLTTLCTSATSCVVQLTRGAIQDMNQQSVVAVKPDESFKINHFVEDSTPPVLMSTTFDLDAETLTLVFDETVNVSSLDVSHIQINDGTNYGTGWSKTDCLSLTNTAGVTHINTSATTSKSFPQASSSVSPPGTVVVVDLSRHDINRLSEMHSVAKQSNRTAYSVRSGAISDMNRVKISPIDHRSFETFQPDTTPPQLTWFDVDMTQGEVRFYFTETVDLATFDISMATAVGEPSSTEARPLTNGKVTNDTVQLDSEGMMVSLTLEDQDLNVIKGLQRAFTKLPNTNLALQQNFVKDHSGNQFDLAGKNKFSSDRFVEDSAKPVLKEFSLDLSENSLTATYSETVNISSFVNSRFWIRSLKAPGGAHTRQLTGATGPLVTAKDWTIFKFFLGREDEHALKVNLELATSIDNTFLASDPSAIADMNRNFLARDLGVQAKHVARDGVAPKLEHFDLNMSNGLLMLQFSEPVNESSFKPGFVVLGNTTLTNQTFVRLTTPSFVRGTGTSAHRITVDLNTAEDLDSIKLRTALAASAKSTFVSLAPGAIADTSNNPSVPITVTSGKRVSSYVQDLTDPILLSYDVNLTSATIDFTFNEAVDISTIDVSQFTLQNNNRTMLQQYQLTDASSGITTTNNGLTATCQIGKVDLNAIKLKRGLCIDKGTTHLHFTSSAFKDMNQRPAVPQLDNKPLQVTRFYEDTIPPELVSFTLDMKFGIRAKLLLSFSEPVLGSSLDMSSISLVGSPGKNSNHTIVPGVGSKLSNHMSSHNGLLIEIDLGSELVNALKKDLDVATDRDSTFLSIDTSAITDMNYLDVVAVRPDTSVERAYKYDTTPPKVVDVAIATLPDGNHKYQVYFDETVDIATIDYAQFQLLATAQCDTGSCAYTLQGGIPLSTENGTMFEFKLTTVDDNNQKVKEMLRDVNGTEFKIGKEFVHDMNYVALEKAIIPVTSAQLETRPPSLVEFNVDIEAALLALTFDEPVRSNTLNISKLSVQSAKQLNSSHAVTLTTNSSTESPNGLIMVINIGLDDLNKIKQDTDLMYTINNSFVSLNRGFIEDMAQVPNPSVEIGTANAMQASGFAEDTTSPELRWFTLNMDTAFLTIHFHEVVSVKSLDVRQISLHNTYDKSASGYAARTLTGGTKYAQALDHVRTIEIELTEVDMNNLKFQRIADTADTTWLSMTNSTLVDANDQFVKGLPKPQAVKAYEADVTRPVMRSFKLSMNSGLLTLSFSETVVPSQVQVRAFTFYHTNGTASDTSYHRHTLSNASALAQPASGEDDAIVYVQLSDYDLNEIKLRDQLCTENSNTYLRVQGNASGAAGVVDTMQIAISTSEKQRALDFKADVTRPALKTYELDLTAETLTLYFTETMFIASNFSSLTLHNGESTSATTKFQLQHDGKVTRSSDGLVLTLKLVNDDLNMIKIDRQLAVSQATTFLSAVSSAFKDMNDNLVEDISESNAQPATKFASDTTDPKVDNFDIDLTLETLTIYFSESVETTSLKTTSLTLQSSGKNFKESFTLTSLSVTKSAPGPVAVVELHTLDLNVIKNLTGLATQGSDTFLRFATGAVADMTDNNKLQDVTEAVRTFKNDTVRPTLLSYELDLDAETLTATFDETVDATSLQVGSFLFLSSANIGAQSASVIVRCHAGTSTSGYKYQLTTNSSTSSPDGTVLVVNIGITDLNWLKQLQCLAMSKDSTHVSIDEAGVVDMNDNKVVEIASDSAQPAKIYTPDDTLPTLVTFDVNMDDGYVHVVFDETVNFTSIVMPLFEFVAANDTDIVTETNVTARHHLTSTYGNVGRTNLAPSSYTDSNFNFENDWTRDTHDSTDLYFTLTPYDLDMLKRKDICFRSTECFLRLDAGAVSDMNGNQVASIADKNKIAASKYDEDITPPTLTDFEVDMDLMTLTLSFSESVQTRKIDFTQITLQGFIKGNNKYTLTGGTTNMLNHRVVTVFYDLVDSNELKKNSKLATGYSDSWITITNETVSDLATVPNALVPIVDTDQAAEAKSAHVYTPDKTSPVLQRFDLNMSSHILTLSFSETVLASSLDVTQITLSGVPGRNEKAWLYGDGEGATSRTPGPQHPYKAITALNSYFVNEADGDVVTIALGLEDSNSLKVQEHIATDGNDTYITITNRLFTDMSPGPKPNMVKAASNMQLSASGGVFTPDNVAPELERFTLDLDKATLLLTFSETVDKSSLDVSRFTFRNTDLSTFDSSYQLVDSALSEFVASLTPNGTIVFDGAVPHDNDYVVVVKLGRADINALSVKTKLATAPSNTYLAVAPGAIVDMNKNPCAPVTAPIQAYKVLDDNTAVKLLDFDVDMDAGQVYMRFSEAVDVATLDTNVITVTNGKNAAYQSYQSHTLTAKHTSYVVNAVPSSGPSHSTSANGAEIVLSLGRKDANKIKQLSTTAVSAGSFMLVFGNQNRPMIKDMHGNFVELWPEYEAKTATLFTADSSAPELLNYDIDLDKGELYLDFDETIRLDTFQGPGTISLLNVNASTIAGKRNITLTSKSALVKGADSSQLTIALSTIDQWRVKNDATLLTALSNGYIQQLAGAVQDMNKNAMAENYATVRTILADKTPPKLQWYSVDLIAGEIIMSFDEPVNPDSLRLGASTFQTGQGETSSQVANLLLSSGLLRSSAQAKTYETGTRLVGLIEDADLSTLQQHMTLLTGTADTYYTFTSDLLTDMADFEKPNPVEPVVPDGARPVKNYTYYDYAAVTNVGPNAGNPAGGSRLTITGSGFQQAAHRRTSKFNGPLPIAVYINGTSATNITVVSDTVLECTSPALADSTLLATPLDVMVKVDQALETIYKSFTYLGSPALDSVKPIAGAFAGSTIVTFYGENFGEDTDTKRGSYVTALFGGAVTKDCTVEGGMAHCATPAASVLGLDPTARHTVDVVIDIDGVTAQLKQAFEYMPVPNAYSITPPSGHYSKDTPVLIQGQFYGPLTSTGLGPPARVYVGDRECYDVAIVNRTGVEAITCVVPKSQDAYGRNAVVVDVAGTNSTEALIFTDYNDAGAFKFNATAYIADETHSAATITVTRTNLPWASPANVTVSVGDGENGVVMRTLTYGLQSSEQSVYGAESPKYYVAATHVLSFAENQYTASFEVTIPDWPDSARLGPTDDRWAKLTIDGIQPLQGVSSAGPYAKLVIEAICNAIGGKCVGFTPLLTGITVVERDNTGVAVIV